LAVEEERRRSDDPYREPSLTAERRELFARFHRYGHATKGWPAETGTDPVPDERHRSLGTFNILALIAAARERGLPHVYLGYYVEGSRSRSAKRAVVGSVRSVAAHVLHTSTDVGRKNSAEDKAAVPRASRTAVRARLLAALLLFFRQGKPSLSQEEPHAAREALDYWSPCVDVGGGRL
jgi:hypothetical protein